MLFWIDRVLDNIRLIREGLALDRPVRLSARLLVLAARHDSAKIGDGFARAANLVPVGLPRQLSTNAHLAGVIKLVALQRRLIRIAQRLASHAVGSHAAGGATVVGLLGLPRFQLGSHTDRLLRSDRLQRRLDGLGFRLARHSSLIFTVRVLVVRREYL